jgi:histidinol-phosphate aminotransferase
MSLSRRSFLGSLGAGTAAAALQIPFVGAGIAVAGTTSTSRSGKTGARLDSNENAYGLSPRMRQAIQEAIGQAHRYPDAARREFLELVAQKHRVSAEQVLLGCGSVELLQGAARAFTGPKKKLITASPTFEVIGKSAEALGAQVARVPLTKDFAHDLTAMRDQMTEDTGLVYICNPNNPTASLTPRKDLDAFISKLPSQTYVLIDEAYHHYATDSRDYLSFLDRPADTDRVIVLRTFSKVYALAGMRLGYGIGPRRAIESMRGTVGWENANIAVLRAAIVGLEDEGAMQLSVRRNAADRAEFMKQAHLRKLSPIPSYGNFAMMDVGRPVPEVIEQLKKKAVHVGRPFPPLNTHLRVSFGRPEDMKAFWAAWDQLPALAIRG